jgi:1-aminocyclopropane-1-carboxylate deaminase
VRSSGGTPYAIPAGASDHRLGGLGFANWAREVQQQEQELGVFFDPIVVCSVTGSTQAGMIAGFAGQDRPRRVLGIDASARIAETLGQVEKIARNTAELIGLGRELRDDEITVLEGWAGAAYGIPDQSTLDAIRLTGRLEGMILDTVYEGKSMAALLDLVRTGEIGTQSTVLYAHLGGQPALNAYSALFRH